MDSYSKSFINKLSEKVNDVATDDKVIITDKIKAKAVKCIVTYWKHNNNFLKLHKFTD